MSEKAKTEETFEPAIDPRFANETPEERRARGKRGVEAYRRLLELSGEFDIDIDELRGRKRS